MGQPGALSIREGGLADGVVRAPVVGPIQQVHLRSRCAVRDIRQNPPFAPHFRETPSVLQEIGWIVVLVFGLGVLVPAVLVKFLRMRRREREVELEKQRAYEDWLQRSAAGTFKPTPPPRG